MTIAREVRLAIVVLLLLAIIAKVYLGWFFAVAVLGLVLPIAFIFRDPARQIPSSPLAIVSPGDGTVTLLETVTDPWVERTAVKCRIHMSLWNVHKLRSPIEGKVRNQWTAAGKEPGVKKCYTYWIQTDEGDDVVFSIATGHLGLFTRVDLHSGERIGQGQPCGHLYFSGLIDVLIPEHTRIALKVGDPVKSGSGIIGQLMHKSSAYLPK